MGGGQRGLGGGAVWNRTLIEKGLVRAIVGIVGSMAGFCGFYLISILVSILARDF